MSKIGFIGAGNMAQAIISGIINAKVYKPADIFLTDVRSDRVKQLCKQYKTKPAADNRELVKAVDIVVLSVKPQNFSQVLDEIRTSINKKHLIVSIAAGITTKRIQKTLGNVPIVRVMPNTPALLGQGAAGMFATTGSTSSPQAKGRLKQVKKIFSAVGIVEVVKNEKLLDAVTAVSGSGPAYFFLLIEEMVKAGVKLGLKRETAEKLVLQTAKGAGILAAESASKGITPDVLRKNVTSPGGTTEAALKVFAKRNFEKIVNGALAAAAKRSRKLSGR
ncbi:MAG: Pyrroline-5-carboxylate reductase [Candidatus Uhrbacteria bacterium GW2011_GWF2_41_16]|uniref:Pyrroline-5-carboxylate reductase n=1 Tax=Candidatus Uhrbacteria bacterium GW2011_GWF2_41_16 TaxID=1618997 RepID=A0A0G0V4F6_9BACT|nr:MAG: Pyrroline-5-carboxylate reductase [Candidatus Uhrbacteria bacterium GW2011_GWF2_41_16]